MPWIRHERTRVRDHAHESRQQAGVGQRVELPFHAFLLIQKPPAAAELQLAGDLAVLKVADHGGESVIVDGIDVVDDGLRQRAFHFQAVEIGPQRGYLRPIADRVETRVRANLPQPPGIGAAVRSQMQLFGPVFLRVKLAEEQHHIGRELRVLLRAGRLSRARPVEDRGRRRFGAEAGVALVQPVIGEPRAQGVKVVVTPPQGIGEVLQATDIEVAGRRQPLHPRVEHIRRLDVQCLIRTKGRSHTRP